MKNKKRIITILADLAMLGLDVLSLYSLMFNRESLSNLGVAAAATMLFISVPLFFYINYLSFGKKLTFEDDENNVNNFDTRHEFEAALTKFKSNRILRNLAEAAIRQLYTLDKKQSTIELVVRQNFSQDVSEFEVVNQVLEDSKEAVYSNMREIINRMTIFGGTENYGGTGLSAKVAAEKNRMLSGHVEFITTVLNNNEIIFLELDKLMIEITKMNGKSQEDDISKIQGIVQSLQMLHDADSSEYEEIAKKYDSVDVPELAGSSGRMGGKL